MALNKIELKLGKKVITLTPAQFEELKQDMRELDKSHYYYWHNYSQPYWNSNNIRPFFLTGTTPVEYTTTMITNNLKDPPAFIGSIVSAS